jgi:hypothetical protein
MSIAQWFWFSSYSIGVRTRQGGVGGITLPPFAKVYMIIMICLAYPPFFLQSYIHSLSPLIPRKRRFGILDTGKVLEKKYIFLPPPPRSLETDKKLWKVQALSRERLKDSLNMRWKVAIVICFRRLWTEFLK